VVARQVAARRVAAGQVAAGQVAAGQVAAGQVAAGQVAAGSSIQVRQGRGHHGLPSPGLGLLLGMCTAALPFVI
jgi:hypothetical protein